jgi:hypothetical protein
MVVRGLLGVLMPWKARIDCPAGVHHPILQGIERKGIFRDGIVTPLSTVWDIFFWKSESRSKMRGKDHRRETSQTQGRLEFYILMEVP